MQDRETEVQPWETPRAEMLRFWIFSWFPGAPIATAAFAMLAMACVEF